VFKAACHWCLRCHQHHYQHRHLLHADFLLGSFFNPEDVEYIFLRKFCRFLTNYTALYPRKQNSAGLPTLSWDTAILKTC
jgi:hypothetical protein